MSQSQMFRSLRHRNARLFFVGLLVSNMGTWMQLTAMSIVVYRLTGRAADVGITLFCQFLPMLVLGVWAGAVSDRVSKRSMAIATQSAMAVQALVLGALELAGLVNLPIVLALSLCSASSPRSTTRPAAGLSSSSSSPTRSATSSPSTPPS